ncbi:hypothetical protein DNL40_15645 [Xylanimonas oleitrophica]|uniref:Uncharacterized protein n=1 Tax=Xylanimonas oleitrophica TaxID=2607479 RepID=A0A2W5YC06_9MICO|nr:hypothetical protein [Xylanimonas oleitrophica]PZR51601.1 hypothetical protein DNL40_15645 [Xylanimonas oleitrophica]
MDTFLAALAALTPSVGVGLIFWFAMRKIVRADRNEREAFARLDAQEAQEHRQRIQESQRGNSGTVAQ